MLSAGTTGICIIQPCAFSIPRLPWHLYGKTFLLGAEMGGVATELSWLQGHNYDQFCSGWSYSIKNISSCCVLLGFAGRCSHKLQCCLWVLLMQIPFTSTGDTGSTVRPFEAHDELRSCNSVHGWQVPDGRCEWELFYNLWAVTEKNPRTKSLDTVALSPIVKYCM